MLEVERWQRVALERSYHETLSALAGALEMRDTGTGAHSARVQLYASEIARAAAPELLDDPTVEYGFLLHDIGKIGIPDRILQKRGPLTTREWTLMRTHAPLGARILEHIGLLRGAGVAVVRHHHERWDGSGYPDALAKEEIPLPARVFANAGTQFDPALVAATLDHEPELRQIHEELSFA